MKLNWGHYVVIGFMGFVVLILFMVYRSYQLKNELVSEDYYAQEIAFQDVIDKKTNASKLKENIIWEKTDNGLLFRYPDLGTEIKGEIYIFRPSDKSLDAHFEISVNKDHQQFIEMKNMTKGKYIIKIDWTVGEIEFFTEGLLFMIK